MSHGRRQGISRLFKARDALNVVPFALKWFWWPKSRYNVNIVVLVLVDHACRRYEEDSSSGRVQHCTKLA